MERPREPRDQILAYINIISKASHPLKFQPAPIKTKFKTFPYTNFPVPWQG